MNKIYYGKEIIQDTVDYQNVMVNIPNLDNLLALELYSQLYEKIPYSTTALNDLKKSIDEYLFNYTIPMIDYSGHVNKEIVILDETNPLDIKIIDSFNYNREEYNKLKNDSLAQGNVAEIQQLYINNVVNKCFDIIKGRDAVTQISIIEFNFNNVTRLKRQ